MQSEVLKKWKRWKLGRNIEEEYRHTYSHPPHIKSGGLLNHTPQLPHLPDIATTSAPACDPEEKHSLMVNCLNGMGRRKGAGQCTSSTSDGTISSCTLVEDISLTDRSQCYEAPRDNAESHL